MKRLRKILKLLIPGALMHRRLTGKYDISVTNPATTAGGRIIVGAMPYVVSAIMQQRRPTDRRPGKYFLPYGKMRRHVRETYGMKVGDEKREKGFFGAVRALMPYGLVLWWDREDERMESEIRNCRIRNAGHSVEVAPSANVSDLKADISALKVDLEHLSRELKARQDEQDIRLLKMNLGARRPSATVIVTGYATPEGYRNAVQDLLSSSLYELEVLLVLPRQDVDANADLTEIQKIDSRLAVLDGSGLTLAAARTKALDHAKGDYVAFLDVSDRYNSRQALSLLLLNVAAEDARMGGGKQAVHEERNLRYATGIQWNLIGRVPSLGAPVKEGLSAFLFKRTWLQSLKLPFFSTAASDDGLFLQATEVLAGSMLVLGRVISVKWRDTIACAHTEVEKAADERESLARLCNYIAASGVPAFDQFLADARERLERYGHPLVSVIVPAYNVEKYLVRCLDSLMNQSLESLEVIVVDDGSVDSTPSLADAYAALHDKVRVIHKKNGGLSSARNAGVAVARGRYIGFVDSDDYVDRNMYAQMANALDTHPDCDFAKCAATIEYTYTVEAARVADESKYFQSKYAGEVALTSEVAADIDSCAWDRLYRRDYLERNGIHYPEGINNEDEVVFFIDCCRARKIFILADRFYHYIKNESGIMSRQNESFKSDGRLPDGLIHSMPFIGELLRREDRLDMLGLYFRKICGLCNRFPGKSTDGFAARLLGMHGFARRQDFLGADNRVYFARRLGEIANTPCDEVVVPEIDERHFPRKCEHAPVLSSRPVVSFIVPVFNAVDNVEFCIDSLRRQSLDNIEILLIDDGSVDGSLETLREYERKDARIRVLVQPNLGVSAARNKGLDAAKGEYVIFIDADDWLEAEAAETAVDLSEKFHLEVCWYDYQCFDYSTFAKIDHYWTFAKHPEIPVNRVFSPSELTEWSFNTGVWQMAIRRDFIERLHLRFPDLKLCEDAVFLYRMLLETRRAYVIPKACYHYRRGNPSSAISRMTAGVKGNAAAEAQVKFVRAVPELIRLADGSLKPMAMRAFMRRLYRDLVFYAEKSAEVRREMITGLRLPLRVDTVLSPGYLEERERLRLVTALDIPEDPTEKTDDIIPLYTEKSTRNKMLEIQKRRASSQKNLVIVTGQLNSRTNEPIDSWTFFQWLQTHGVPSRYVIWKEHDFLRKLKSDGRMKDVIVMKGNGVEDDEFLDKCHDELVNACAVVQENVALHPRVWRWLTKLPECNRVFLQHGVMFWKQQSRLAMSFAGVNTVNVSSEREKRFLEATVPVHPDIGVPVQYVVAGLPRYDLLEDERDPDRKEYVLFVMFTWRSSFGDEAEDFLKSAYWRHIQSFLSSENLARLSKHKVRIVLALHHHFANHLGGLKLELGVDIAKTSEISYWIRHADACLTDYSSVSFDFAYLHKPTIFWIPDADDVLLNEEDRSEIKFARHQSRDLYNSVEDGASALRLIERYAAREFKLEDDKCKIADTFFAYRKGTSAQLYKMICNDESLRCHSRV